MSLFPKFVTATATVAKAAKAAKEAPKVSNFSNFSGAADLSGDAPLPLAAKLRAYGQPFPLTVDDKVKCWLVPDAAAARELTAAEPVYTAEEVEYLATLSAADVLNLHAAKAASGGTVKACPAAADCRGSKA